MNLFLTGATGYIGGSVARGLVEAGHSVRGLCRDAAQAPALSAMGVIAVIGTLDDGDLLAREARAADGVIHTASNMHEAGIAAMLGAIEGSGKPFLHTSGIGLISRDVRGDDTTDEVVDDDGPVEAGPHPAQRKLQTLEHRIVGTAGVRSVVLSNAMVYGNALGLERQSIQISLMRTMAEKAGVALHVGRGVNRWSNVHIEDAVRLYRTALERSDARGFYFVEGGEADFTEIARALALRLKLGGERSASLAQASDLVGESAARFLLGSEARVRASRARQELGWRPVGRTLIDWIGSEVRP